MEGRRIFGFREPTIKIDQIPTKDLLGDFRERIHQAEKYNFRSLYVFNSKTTQRRTGQKIYGSLREVSLNCDLGSQEESIIPDVFIANMRDGEIQRELLKEKRSARKR